MVASLAIGEMPSFVVTTVLQSCSPIIVTMLIHVQSHISAQTTHENIEIWTPNQGRGMRARAELPFCEPW
jgi:hypothetical protein